MFEPKGYHVASGYVGLLGDGSTMFFATERDYLEYISSRGESHAD